MEIKVTGCHDCEFSDTYGFCSRLEVLVNRFVAEHSYPNDCPLKQQSITVKLEENDTN